MDLRKEHECRIELHKHLEKNKILYGEISPNLLIAISDFLLEWEGKNANTSKRQLTIPDVSNNEALELCDGVAFANYIEEKWKDYRAITNNEDAWCFKQWLVGK